VDLERALAYDESMRVDGGKRLFVHPFRMRLREALQWSHGGDLSLFANECRGYCGV